MKLKLTLIVFREGVNQGELDVIAEYPSTLDAIRGIVQLGASNSILYTHPDVKALFEDASPASLARIHERMGEGCVVQIKHVAEHLEVMPEDLRNNPHAFLIIASRPKRVVPPEGILEPVHDGQIH